MSFLDACDLIDNELAELQARDMFGDIHEGQMAIPYVYKILGSEFDEPQQALTDGLITVDEYAERMISLIRKCGRLAQSNKINKTLRDLHSDQVELDLI